MLGHERDVDVAQQNVRHAAQHDVPAAAGDPRLDLAYPLAPALVELLDHLDDTAAQGTRQHERAGEEAQERRPRPQAAAPARRAHDEQPRGGVPGEHGADGRPTVGQQPVPVAQPRLDGSRVLGTVGDHEPPQALVPPAEGGHLLAAAVEQARLHRRRGGRHGHPPGRQAVAALSQPPGHRRCQAALDRLPEHAVRQAVELHHEQTGPAVGCLLTRALPGPGPRAAERVTQDVRAVVRADQPPADRHDERGDDHDGRCRPPPVDSDARHHREHAPGDEQLREEAAEHCADRADRDGEQPQHRSQEEVGQGDGHRDHDDGQQAGGGGAVDEADGSPQPERRGEQRPPGIGEVSEGGDERSRSGPPAAPSAPYPVTRARGVKPVAPEPRG